MLCGAGVSPLLSTDKKRSAVSEKKLLFVQKASGVEGGDAGSVRKSSTAAEKQRSDVQE